jgi:N-methylhydantoinase B
VPVRASQRVVVESPGAGGYGPPDERSPEAVDADRREGRISEDFQGRFYEARR